MNRRTFMKVFATLVAAVPFAREPLRWRIQGISWEVQDIKDRLQKLDNSVSLCVTLTHKENVEVQCDAYLRKQRDSRRLLVNTIMN